MKKKLFIILSVVSGGVFSVLAIRKLYSGYTQETQIEQWKELSDKHLALMQLYDKWMITKQDGRSIVEYFDDNHIQTIAIYGMASVGLRLQDELRKTNVEVKYGIDKYKYKNRTDLDIVTPDEKLEKVDAIIVTAIYYFAEIRDELSKKTDIAIISLEEVLDWIW